MAFKTVSKTGVRSAARRPLSPRKETTLAAIEPHPTHPERELHTYRCGLRAGRNYVASAT